MTHTDIILKQCKLQGATSPAQIAGFARAYENARWIALEEPSGIDWKFVIHHWASMIEPEKANGYRRVPVFFSNGNRALDANLVPRAMKFLCFGLDNETKRLENLRYPPLQLDIDAPTQLYKEFEVIHPFLDGNGRVGHLIWAVLKMFQNEHWPMELPPEVF
ncbi:MAG: Fic family protein [Candidatus Thorarchaeota archaeon]|jgi:Fic family protein